jgi:putative ABC transport system permease protein
MTTFFQIAFLNVFRHKRRTALTVLMISFGSAALVLAGGFAFYNFDGLRDTTIRNGLGHLQLFSGAYLDEGEDQPLQQGIADYRGLQQWLERQDRVVATNSEIEFVGLVSNGEKSETFLGRAADPDRERAMGFTLTIKDGQRLTNRSDEAQALLGVGLAKALKVKVGDVLTIMGTTAHGALNGIDVRVAGLYTTGITEYDARALSITLDAGQRLLDTDRVTKIVIKLDSSDSLDAARASLVAAGLGGRSGLRVKTWRELATFYNQVVRLYMAIFAFLGMIIVILVVLSSSNTMMMTVLERVTEIGTMMAIGTRRRQILSIFVFEGFVTGVVGGLCGIAVSYGLSELLNNAGLMMPPPPTFSTGFPLLVKEVPVLFAGVFLLMVVTMTISAIAPAMRGARMRIVDALGHI